MVASDSTRDVVAPQDIDLKDNGAGGGAIHYFSNFHMKLNKRRMNMLIKYAGKHMVTEKEGRQKSLFIA